MKMQARARLRDKNPVAERADEVEGTIVVLEREFGMLGVHERIVLTRELTALIERVAWTFERDDW
jgi:hypothetical protein